MTAKTLDRDGIELVRDALSAGQRLQLLDAIAGREMTHARRKDSTFGGRNLLAIPAISDIADRIRHLAAAVPNACAARALFFDKTPEANWPVLWHQDLTIALKERHDIDDWGPWSVKAGVPHVEPPVQLLERMLAIRLHLDDSDADNGPLRVLPGTHRLGRLTRDRIGTLRAEITEATALAPQGAALLMRPLLLHASSPATNPTHRRVVHIEYAPADALPAPLAWAH